MTPDLLARCRSLIALGEAATKGPWEFRTYDGHDGPADCDRFMICADLNLYGHDSNGMIAEAADAWGDDLPREAHEANAAFIAAAPDLLAMLQLALAELEAHADREAVAAWMIARGIATGHGDTVEDLLAQIGGELKDKEGRIAELMANVKHENAARSWRDDE